MPGDRNNTLQDYLGLADSTQAGAQLRLNHAGRVVEKTRDDRVQAFIGNNVTAGNRAILLDFKAVLTGVCGVQAAEHAFQESGLATRLETGGALTARQVQTAARSAELFVVNEQIQRNNAGHLQAIADRNQQAAQWQPQPQASTLTPAQCPGLRYDHSDQGEMRIHAWHLNNNPGHGVFELDDAVRAEMAAMPNGTDDPRLDNLQARLNLLEKMVGEAGQQLRGPADQPVAEKARANVFTAPEWLFCGLEGRHENNAVSGGALTEAEMRKVTEALTGMSARNPGMVILPGTLLWSKPVDPTPTIEGQLRPMDMVFNSAPIVANGDLIHITNKQKEGFDPSLAAKGLPNEPETGMPYKAPSFKNDFGARLQVFKGDGNRGNIDVTAALQQIEQIAGAGRAIPQWEAALRPGGGAPANWEGGFQMTAQAQANNHLFEFGGRTFALDVCADHSPMTRGAKTEATTLNGDPLRVRIATEGGVDVHLVISSGSGLATTSNFVKNGGVYAGNDLNEGLAQCMQMTHGANLKGELARPVPMAGQPGAPVQFPGPPAAVAIAPAGPALPDGGGAPALPIGGDGEPGLAVAPAPLPDAAADAAPVAAEIMVNDDGHDAGMHHDEVAVPELPMADIEPEQAIATVGEASGIELAPSAPPGSPRQSPSLSPRRLS